MWKIQHNILHHSFTNIDGLDEDIDTPSILRFSPERPLKKVHKLQFIYAWFFYGIMTIFWMTAKDWMALAAVPRKKGLIKSSAFLNPNQCARCSCRRRFTSVTSSACRSSSAIYRFDDSRRMDGDALLSPA